MRIAFLIPAAGLLCAQMDITQVPEEPRFPMTLVQVKSACKIFASGEAWVGSRSTAGGVIKARISEGGPALAVRGATRFHLTSGSTFDNNWHFETIGKEGVPSFTITPPPRAFPTGGKVVRAELRVEGAYFQDGGTCGPEGNEARAGWLRVLDSARADVEEALALATKVPEPQFLKSVQGDLIRQGPYSRTTSPTMNVEFKRVLLATPARLEKDYLQRLKNMKDELTPSTPLRQPRSSRQPGP